MADAGLICLSQPSVSNQNTMTEHSASRTENGPIFLIPNKEGWDLMPPLHRLFNNSTMSLLMRYIRLWKVS